MQEVFNSKVFLYLGMVSLLRFNIKTNWHKLVLIYLLINTNKY